MPDHRSADGADGLAARLRERLAVEGLDAFGASRSHRRNRASTSTICIAARSRTARARGRGRDRRGGARPDGPAGGCRGRARETAPAGPRRKVTTGRAASPPTQARGPAIRLNRSFSAIVVLTLAIGIGACTAVFSIVNALLLRSLPYPNPQQLRSSWETEGDIRDARFIVALPVYEDWKKETRSFSAMGIWEDRTYNVASTQEPEQVQGIRATSSLFTTLGVSPALGRVFTEEEEAPGHHVVVISDNVWRNHFAAQASAIGSTIRLNGATVRSDWRDAEGFRIPAIAATASWVPFAKEYQDEQRGSHSFCVAARMKPDVTFEQARADVEQVGRALRQRYEENRDEGSTLTMMADQGLGTLRTMLTFLMGAVTLVLLIGCVNVANLQLGRALTRRREFALRLALGAGIGRLARQLFAESVVLAAAGGIGGLALAWMTTRAADLILTPGFRTLPFRGDVPITIDARVLLFAAGGAGVGGAVRIHATDQPARAQSAGLLREGERGSTGVANVARRALVAIEVGAGDRRPLRRGPLDQEPVGIAAGQSRRRSKRRAYPASLFAASRHLWAAVREQFCSDLSRSAEGLPGIRRIGAISHLPLSGANAGRAITVEGYEPKQDESVSASYRLTCPGYFGTLGIAMIEGRDFSARDLTKGEPVVIITARRQMRIGRKAKAPSAGGSRSAGRAARTHGGRSSA